MLGRFCGVVCWICSGLCIAGIFMDGTRYWRSLIAEPLIFAAISCFLGGTLLWEIGSCAEYLRDIKTKLNVVNAAEREIRGNTQQ